MRRTILFTLLTMALVGISCTYAINNQGQPVLKEETVIATVNVGRYPHGVAVNEETDRIYVANLNEGSISVIEGTTNEVIDTIEVGKGPRDVAVNGQTNCLYVASILARDVPAVGLGLYRAEFGVSVMDGQTNETLANVVVGTNPWLIEVNEATNRIYVANYGSHDVSVIDGERNEVIATIGMGLFRTPTSIAVNEETKLTWR